MHAYMIDLPWTTPPLSLNDRRHWAAKARITREVRATTRILARAHHLPTGMTRVRVRLVYTPRDRRRRDPSNLLATQKPVIDGLIDYGLVPDDTPEYVEELMPRITAPGRERRRSRIAVEITECPPAAAVTAPGGVVA